MPAKKPVAKRKAYTPKRQSRKSADADRDAKHARKRVKDRLSALEAEIRVLRVLHESLLDEVRQLMQRADNPI